MKADGIEYDERMALLDADHLAAAAGRAAGGDRTRSTGRRHPWLPRGRAVAEVGRARDVGAGDELHRLRRPLPAGPVRGAGAALPHRRLPHAAPDGAGGAPHPRARRPGRVAGGDRSARPTPRCSTSGRRSATPSTCRAGSRTTSRRRRRARSASRTRTFEVMVRNAMWARVDLVARDDLDGLMRLERAAAERTDPPRAVVMGRSVVGRGDRGLLRRARHGAASTATPAGPPCSTWVPSGPVSRSERGGHDRARARRTPDDPRPGGPPRLGDRRLIDCDASDEAGELRPAHRGHASAVIAR